MSAPPLSVVVPTFRRPAMLAEALEEALAQIADQSQIEIVVVDNCPDASARAAVEAFAAPHLRYVHEPRSGVVHARNAGVAASRGAHVVFLDDDERPVPGWLAAFSAAAACDVAIGFGPITPRYEATPDPRLIEVLDRLYRRALDRADGAQIDDLWARLGTGNSIFRKALLPKTPFDPRFNATGGEDMDLILRLMNGGAGLTWIADAGVEEIVPADRMTLDYMKRRRFNQGRIRCLLAAARPGWRGRARVAFWMSVGLAQACFYAVARMFAPLIGGDPGKWAIRMQGGLGKFLWNRHDSKALYAQT